MKRPSKLFQLGIIFVGEVRASKFVYLRTYCLCPWQAVSFESNVCECRSELASWTTLQWSTEMRAEALTLPLNIRLICKGLPGANTLAYLAVVSVTMTLAPGFLLTRELEHNGIHLGADL
jgi:hypothetical protein